MGYKKKLRLASVSVLGLGGVAGLTAGLVACGSTDSVEPGLYYSTISKGSFSQTKTDKNIVVWIPWSNTASYAQAASAWILNSLGANSNGYIDSGEMAGYTVEPRFTDSTPKNTVSFSGAVALSSLLTGGDPNVIADIVIAYPDVAAVFAEVGLLHDLGSGASDLVAQGFLSDVNSVPNYDGTRPNYVLPFSKTTDMSGFDVVVFAKIISDTAKAVAEAGGSDSFKVPANSDQDRMFRMILAPTTVSTSASGATVLALNMDGIYDDNAQADADGNVTYRWSELDAQWTAKTATKQIWAPDKPVVEANFSFKNTDAAKTALTSVDNGTLLFGNFQDLGSFSKKILQAYNLNHTDLATSSTYVYGFDSITNAVYSYQYDAAGHTQDNFFINTKPVTVDGTEKSGVLRYEMYDPATSKSFVEAADWLTDGVRSGATFLKTPAASGSTVYGSALLQDHKMLLSIGSTNGASNYTDRTSSYSAKTNVGEVYFGLQPTKAYATEAKNSVINQGPSIFVTDIHGKETGTRIANKLLAAYQKGANVVTDSNNVSKDTGYWSSTGYMYGNKSSYLKADNSPSDYVKLLSTLTKSPSGWAYNISKRLLVDYLAKAAADPSRYDLYTNPVAAHTAAVRDMIDNQYAGSFGNYFLDASQPLPSGEQIAKLIAATGVTEKWLTKA